MDRNDLISRSALKEEVNKKQVVGRFNVLNLIDNAPTVSLSTPSDIDELCRLRSDLKSGLYVGSTLRTQAQMNKFVEVLDKIIDNAPTVEPDISEIEEKFWHRCGFLQGYTTGLKDKERPQGEWIDYDNTFYKCPDCGYLLEKCCPQCQNKVILPKGGADMRQDNEPDRQITIEEYMNSLKGENQ